MTAFSKFVDAWNLKTVAKKSVQEASIGILSSELRELAVNAFRELGFENDDLAKLYVGYYFVVTETEKRNDPDRFLCPRDPPHMIEFAKLARSLIEDFEAEKFDMFREQLPVVQRKYDDALHSLSVRLQFPNHM